MIWQWIFFQKNICKIMNKKLQSYSPSYLITGHWSPSAPLNNQVSDSLYGYVLYLQVLRRDICSQVCYELWLVLIYVCLIICLEDKIRLVIFMLLMGFLLSQVRRFVRDIFTLLLRQRQNNIENWIIIIFEGIFYDIIILCNTSNLLLTHFRL